MDNATAVFTGEEDAETIDVLAAGVFVEMSKTGVMKIYNNGVMVFEIGVGQMIDDATLDGAYFAVTNAEGYVALYKNDGTRLFGFDKEITAVDFAEE